MMDIDAEGYLKIAREEDRVTVASILYKNGYAVRPYRAKKNGKSYEYFVRYKKVSPEASGAVMDSDS